MTRASQLFSGGGVHYKDPWLMAPMTVTATALSQYDSSASANTSATVAFFTGLGTQGVIDSTNWSADTYKSVYSHTGKGLIGALVGPTAGGADTTTFEITLDGVLSTITVTNASGERALLSASAAQGTSDWTTAVRQLTPGPDASSGGVLDASTLTTIQTATFFLPSLRWFHMMGVPLLQYNISALVRMKHSSAITNSTATAYSGVMVRKGIAA